MTGIATSVTFSKMEKDIIDFCVSQYFLRPDGHVTLQSVIDRFYPDGAPKHAPSAMARRLRMIQLKTHALGIPGPRRVSKVGRGNRAVYAWG